MHFTCQLAGRACIQPSSYNPTCQFSNSNTAFCALAANYEEEARATIQCTIACETLWNNKGKAAVHRPLLHRSSKHLKPNHSMSQPDPGACKFSTSKYVLLAGKQARPRSMFYWRLSSNLPMVMHCVRYKCSTDKPISSRPCFRNSVDSSSVDWSQMTLRTQF